MLEENIIKIANIEVLVSDTTVVEILNENTIEPIEYESTTGYYYDLLEVECNNKNIDFSSLMVVLFSSELNENKLIKGL